MSAPSHTPGPWNLNWAETDNPSITQTSHITRDVWQIPRNRADWILIAAAPELLQSLSDMLMACGMAAGTGDPIRPNDPALVKARAVIAKATGQEESK